MRDILWKQTNNNSGQKAMKKNKLIVIILLFCCADLAAQDILLRKDVHKQRERNMVNDFGPNTKYFRCLAIGYGVIMPVNESDSLAIVERMSSPYLEITSRHKFRLSQVFAFGLDLV